MAEFALIALPLVVGYGSSFACKIGPEAGKTVMFRPPSTVFGIAWPILYLCMGTAWCLACRTSGVSKSRLVGVHVANALLLLTLVLWPVLYSCQKNRRAGVWVLLPALLFAATVVCLAPAVVPRVLALPLLVWLGFALLMNAVEVQEMSRENY